MPAATVDHSQRICEVWACNLDDRMKKICQVTWKYNYVAMGTKFPVSCDVKYLMKSCKNLKGGLQEVTEPLELE
uniref:Uncharacterized protein n=1 Tax=Vombatus ursinus TaxID=29139 RepID=A0A4X2KYU7_VOMUR